MDYNDLFIDSHLPEPLTKNQVYDYLERYQFGDESAKDEIIKHNIRLVINQVIKRFGTTPYEKKELVSIGLVGLIKSVNTFNISKNVEFATYATRCIDNEILMFMRKGKKYINDGSLEQPIGTDTDGKDLKIEDILSDDSSDFVSDYEDKETYKIVRKIVDELPDRERKIVMLHFGFIDDKIYTQKEIANKLNISQAYVSRLITKIVKKVGKRLVDNGVIDTIKEKPINQELKSVVEQNLNIDSKEKEKKTMSKRLQSLYEYFNTYSKEEIDLMISKLTDEEKELLGLRYGEDLEHPVTSQNWGKEQNIKFYGNLVPRMKRLLSNPDFKRRTRTKEMKVSKVVPPVETSKKELTTSTSEQGKSEVLQGNVDINMTKEDYIKILEMMRNPNFEEMLKVLNPKEATIVCLKLGYVDGKYFTTDSIAGFLGIEQDEVIKTTKKVLSVYKENLNTFIDQAVSVVTDQPDVLKQQIKMRNK